MKRTRRSFTFALMISALLVTTVACGKTSNKDASVGSKSTTTTDGLKTRGPGTCNVKLTGAETKTISGKGGVSALSSDYWYSTAKLQSALDQVNQVATSTTASETAKQKVARGEFVLSGLILNCFESVGDHYSVDFTTTSYANRTNFPFKAATYDIDNSSTTSLLHVILAAGSGKIWKITGGSFVLTKFDTSGVTGTFTVDATEDTFGQGTPGALHADGTFNMPCAAGNNCSSI